MLLGVLNQAEAMDSSERLPAFDWSELSLLTFFPSQGGTDNLYAPACLGVGEEPTVWCPLWVMSWLLCWEQVWQIWQAGQGCLLCPRPPPPLLILLSLCGYSDAVVN